MDLTLEKLEEFRDRKSKFDFSSDVISTLSDSDILNLSYSVFQKFKINFLSMTSFYSFENKFYDWVMNYIVGYQFPTNLNLIRGIIVEEYLLRRIQSFDKPEKFAENGKEYLEIYLKNDIEAKGIQIDPYTEEDLNATKSFIYDSLYLNYPFFKNKKVLDTHIIVKKSIENSVMIYGFADGLIMLEKQNGEKVQACVELKTTERIPKEPYEHHIRQLAFYMSCLNIDLGYIYYVGKGSSSRKGVSYLKAFAFQRENLEDYINNYLRSMIIKMTKFLMKFNSKQEIIDIVIPRFGDFLFNQNLRELYEQTFKFPVSKNNIVPAGEYTLTT